MRYSFALLLLLAGCTSVLPPKPPMPPMPPATPSTTSRQKASNGPIAAPTEFRITSIVPAGETVLLSWQNAPPGEVTVEGALDIFGPWSPLGSTSSDQLTVPRSGDRGFYRLTMAPPPAGQTLWVALPATAINDSGRALARDAFGHFLFVGDMNGGARIIRYAPDGSIAWEKQFGSSFAFGVACDSSANVFVTGYFQGNIDLGGGTLQGFGAFETAFIVKYDVNGNHLWSKSYPSGGRGSGQALACVGSVVYLAGYAQGNLEFGCGPRGGGAYLVQLDNATGSCQWSRTFTGDNTSLGVSANQDGVYVCGRFLGSVDFGGTVLTSQGYDAFAASYSISGVLRWASRFGGPLLDTASAISIGDGLYMVGNFRGPISFGGPTLTNGTSADDGYLVKLTPAGGFIWQRHFAGASGAIDRVHAVASGATVMVGGMISGAYDFGGGQVAANFNDIFIASYNPEGSLNWARMFGDFSIDAALAVCDGGASGSWSGNVNFGTGLKTSIGGGDAFIMRVSE